MLGLRWWEEGIGRGIRGAPATLSKSWMSTYVWSRRRESSTSAEEEIQDLMFAQDLGVVGAEGVLFGEENMSSGIGTSRTVSSPSSLS